MDKTPQSTEGPTSLPARSWQYTGQAARQTKDHLKDRYGEYVDRRPEDRFRDAVRHSRPLVYAEAIALFVIGLSIDDMAILRLPGFVAGGIAALAVFVFGGLLHGGRLAARVHEMTREDQDRRLRRSRAFGRLLLVAVSIVTVVWLFVFSSGVAPWVV